MKQIPLVTLITDFGSADAYVGTMKGVILGIAPDAQLVDICHEIAPQDVRQAAFVLYAAYVFFPPHTVHLVVVDPGVGSARRPIALRTSVGCFVGPDNGVLSYIMARERVEALVELSEPRYRLPQVSCTFHGRDVFAPAAAHLAAGVPVTALGPPVRDLVVFPPPRLEFTSDGIAGEVLHTDRFGNVITSIGHLRWGKDELSLEPAFQYPGGRTQGAGCRRHDAGGKKQKAVAGRQVRFRAAEAVVVAAGHEIAGVHRTYAEVEPGEVVALVGSERHLEIAVREGHAAPKLGLHPGDAVVLRLR